MKKQSYDLIGDIHGQAPELVRLLEKLSYLNVDGVWQHTERKVIFLGDFVDRGDYQREVIDIVRPMVLLITLKIRRVSIYAHIMTNTLSNTRLF